MNDSRPFDARFELLTDQELPEASWSVISLVTAIRQYVQRDPTGVLQPCDEHDRLLKSCADELILRGLDADSLVRYGLPTEIAGGVISLVVQAWFDTINPSTSRDANDPGVVWFELVKPYLAAEGLKIEEGVEPRPEQISALIVAVYAAVMAWIPAASLEDLLALTPPRELPPVADGSTQYTLKLSNEYRWAVDRFSTTHIHEWSDESLKLEFGWIKGKGASPCAPELMDVRDIPLETLALHIADRAVGDRDRPRLDPSLTTRMHQQALGLLKDLRYEEAATLFQFAVNEDPDDPAALNNLAFCLLPTDPRRALKCLIRSADLGFPFKSINVCNRVLCLLRLKGAEAALELAQREWNSLPSDDPARPAAMWMPDSGGLALVEHVMPKQHLGRVGLKIAKDAGLTADIQFWTANLRAA